MTTWTDWLWLGVIEVLVITAIIIFEGFMFNLAAVGLRLQRQLHWREFLVSWLCIGDEAATRRLRRILENRRAFLVAEARFDAHTDDLIARYPGSGDIICTCEECRTFLLSCPDTIAHIPHPGDQSHGWWVHFDDDTHAFIPAHGSTPFVTCRPGPSPQPELSRQRHDHQDDLPCPACGLGLACGKH